MGSRLRSHTTHLSVDQLQTQLLVFVFQAEGLLFVEGNLKGQILEFLGTGCFDIGEQSREMLPRIGLQVGQFQSQGIEQAIHGGKHGREFCHDEGRGDRIRMLLDALLLARQEMEGFQRAVRREKRGGSPNPFWRYLKMYY